MKKKEMYPPRWRLVITGDWGQFCSWLRQDEFYGNRAVFVRDFEDLAGKSRKEIEIIKWGEWYKNEKAIEAISKWLNISREELL